MTTSAKLPDGSPTKYGMGWVNSQLFGHPVVWHNGGVPGFGARNVYFPERDVEIVVLGNTIAIDPGRVVRAVYSALYSPNADEIAANDLHDPVPDNPGVTRLARSVFDGFASGSIDHSFFTPEANSAFTDALVAQVGSQLKRLGTPDSFNLLSRARAAGYIVYVYRLEWAGMRLNEQLTLDPKGLIAGLIFSPTP